MTCECGKDAVYHCSTCRKPLCPEHSKFRVVCSSCIKKIPLKYRINKLVKNKERDEIRKLVKLFWGEEEQLTFGKESIVAELPTYVAKSENKIIGFVSSAKVDSAILIVALGVLPQYQSSGVGRSLIGKIEEEAKKCGRKKLLVSTSNDDLPALAFYQSLGFQIYDVKPNFVAEKHGEILEGIGGLPVRDELRLRKILH